jgi:hypothetical protein
MRRNTYWWIAVLLVVCLQVTGCRQNSDSADDEERESGPATVEHLEGAEPTRITLTEDAARRLDIQTETIRDEQVEGAQQRVIPYAAILYDTQGETWAYTNPEPLAFVRHHIVVDRINGNQAILSDGPPAGTAVVTVGAAELYGSEIEFEEE